MDYESLLNERQLAAVKTNSQFVRIIAGAGSGKTRVLTYRISYLISDFHVDPSRILAITFTNKAAQEMGDRASKLVYQLLGEYPPLHISTFHSFCSRFLRIEHEAFGYPTSFTIYDEDDQKRLVRNAAAEFGHKKGDEVVKKAFEYIRKKKAKGLYPYDITIKFETFKDEKECLKIYTRYEEMKTEAYALDFDDLLLKTIWILDTQPDIQEKWSHRFDHILVDEFQDTNDIQYALIKLLMSNNTSLYVVGDPDQTIYTWRNANMKIILDFEKNFPNVETVILNENYRSTKTILDAANLLIAKNRNRVPKDLYSNLGEGKAIEVNNLPNAEEEASWVAGKIADIARKQSGPEGEIYSNIAILYRSSYMTRAFESALKDRKIPYRIFGGVRFYERMEVKDLLAYFNLMVNPLDNVAFERIVNVPKRGVGDTSLDKIRQEAKEHGLSEYNYIKDIHKYQDETDIPRRVILALNSMVNIMEETKDQLTENLEVYSSILQKFVTKLEYFTYLKENEEPDEDRIGNVNALFEDIDNFIKRNPEATFDEYLANVSLLSAQDDINGGNYVSLMTIHVAKGLEFDHVFVICMNDGAFPSERSRMDEGRDGEEEERRLAYVAFTRAKKELYASCNNGYSYMTDSHAVPSQFFREAGLSVPKHTGFFSDNPSWGSRPRVQRGAKGHYKGESAWFFKDEPSQDPFENEKQVKKEKEPVVTNGITDWHVGDKCHHEKFGDGVVTVVIDETMIKVEFAEGTKTLLSNHRMLTRVSSKGGAA
ncbi:MAG: ATP-dependent helicase [Bacilli bacterium]|nr:ATP-dependent helicase [Bacilli bacterium]